MKRWSAFAVVSTAIILELLPVAVAHGHDGEDNNVEMDMTAAESPADMGYSYFRHPDHVKLIVAHIALMSIGWIFVLPIGKQTCGDTHRGTSN